MSRIARAAARTLPALLLLPFLPIAAVAANPSGDLRVEVVTAYNLIVDSNVESPSSYCPRSAYLGATFYNTGNNDLTNVFCYIGNYVDGTNDTPGVYPMRVHPPLVGPLTNGAFALQHEGGASTTNDAIRFVIEGIPAHSNVTVYWLVSYPLKDQNGDAVWGPSVKPDDDLWLEYDVWCTASDAGVPVTALQTRTVTMRNEISAMANKILPNTANQVPQEYLDLMQRYVPEWTNGYYDGSLGTIVALEGYWYNLGNVGQGFDNNGDLVPDQNAWMQPVGDPSKFDPSCYRLVKTRAMVVVKLKTGAITNDSQEEVYITEDKLYFENVPDNNCAIGLVIYEWAVLAPGSSSMMTPYQEVASGFDNEKFNGDYGVSGSPFPPPKTNTVVMSKTVDKAIALPGTNLLYEVAFTNIGNVPVGEPKYGVPLVVQDAIPAGTYYIGGSATQSNTPPAGVSGYTVLYSTNAGVRWTTAEPSIASNVTHLQWWLQDSLPTGASGIVRFRVNIKNPYTNSNPLIHNVAGLSMGNSYPFLWDDADTLVIGTNTLGDMVYRDDGTGGGGRGNAIQDGGERGISNIAVRLYIDANMNGIIDDNEMVRTATTDTNGYYLFTGLPDGQYIAQVDMNDADLPFGYTITTSNSFVAGLDVARTSTMGVAFLNADFGFAPALLLDKAGPTTLREGQRVTYTITVTNELPGNGGGTLVTVWPTNGTDGGHSKAWLNTTNAFTPPAEPDGAYATGPCENADETLRLNGYNTPRQAGNIASVVLRIPYRVVGAFDTTDDVVIYCYRGGTRIYGVTNLLSSMPVTNSEFLINLTTNTTWTWNDFTNNNPTAVEFITGGKPKAAGVFEIDSAGFIITSDQSVSPTNNVNTTLEPVPLDDRYDADVLRYVSASPWPTWTATNGTAPDTYGYIHWNNVGPIYAGGATTVTVTFLVLQPPNNTTSSVTNTAMITEAKFANGRPANLASDEVVSVISPAGTIGDYVWRDIDGDGVQDGGSETGIAYVSVVLFPPVGVDVGNGAGRPITNRTDLNGYYLFTGLPADGTYTVSVLTATLPSTSFTNTFDWDNKTNSPNNETAVYLDFDSTTNADTFLNADFGYKISSSIIGTIWHDYNRSGTPWPDLGEEWLTNVTVYLYSNATATGVPIGTNRTDTNGFFRFTGNYSGTYSVRVVTNSGAMTNSSWTETYDTDGLTNLNYSQLTVVGGGCARVDFSYVKTGPYNIGDQVYYDLNDNHIQDATEEGINNIHVYLYQDEDRDGVVDYGVDALIAVATNGLYRFTNMPPGSYQVVVGSWETNFPAGLYCNTDPYGANDGKSVVVITNADNWEQDFGYKWSSTASGSIGDFVWRDLNASRTQDGGRETGIVGVAVTLWTDLNNDGVYVSNRTVLTDSAGYYLFDSLGAGKYRVTVQTNDLAVPRDSFGFPYWPTTPTNRWEAQRAIYVDKVLTNAEHYRDADFGFAEPSAVGDTVFWDLDQGGSQDYNEPGVPGVTVSLYRDVDTNDFYTPGVDVLVATQVTDSAGQYLFAGLYEGQYIVRVTTNSGPLLNRPCSADPDSDGVPFGTNCDSQCSVLLYPGTVYLGADFGYVRTGVIGDTVWIDSDGDGVRDDFEFGIPWVSVLLYLTNGSVLSTNETDVNGYYYFSGLTDGVYRVVVQTNDTDFPPALTNTYCPDGTLDSIAQQIVITNGHISTVKGTTWTNGDLAIDFGYRYPGTNMLSGTVGIEDVTYNGVMGTGTSGVGSNEVACPRVMVYLSQWRDTNGNGKVEADEAVLIAKTQTDTNGDYAFYNIPFSNTNGSNYVVSLYAPEPSLYLTTSNGCTPATMVTNRAGLDGYTDSALQVVPIAPVITNMDFAFRSVRYDFGDLPQSYCTLRNGPPKGARHYVPTTPDLYLGARVDTEVDGRPSADALGDDTFMAGSTNDEDGVRAVGVWTNGAGAGSVSVVVGAGSGWLLGYIDFNNDGDMTEPGEMCISKSVSSTGGGTTNTFTIPAGTFSTNPLSLYARFRLFPFDSEPGFAEFFYSGEADNGEVEDYLWQFGVIGDYVWKDWNRDGVQDASEPGISNVTVYIDLNSNGVHDASEPVDVTDTFGQYAFGGITPGYHTVRVVSNSLPPDVLWPTWDRDGTGTPHVATVSVTNRQVRLDVDFGYAFPLIDLGVIKDVNNETPGELETIAYTIRLTNAGPDTATGVVLTDVLPSGVTYSNSSVTKGAYVSASGLWTVGTMTNGEIQVLCITARVDSGTAGMSITNWAIITGHNEHDPNPDNDQDDAPIMPTWVVVSRFESLRVGGQVAVEWETASEIDTVAFDVLRLDPETGKYRKISDVPVPSVMLPQGGTYRLVDEGADPKAVLTYMLLEFERSGSTRSYGPFVVNVGRSEKASGERLTKAAHGSSEATKERLASRRRAREDARNSLPAGRAEAGLLKGSALAGKGARAGSSAVDAQIKVTLDALGLYYLDNAQIGGLLGITTDRAGLMLKWKLLTLTNRGRQVAYLGADNGCYFLGEEPGTVYAKQNVYWLGRGGGSAMGTVAGGAAAAPAGQTFRETVHAEVNFYEATGVFRDPECDYWLWDFISAGWPGYDRKSFTCRLDGVAAGVSQQAELEVRMFGATDTPANPDHHAVIELNGVTVGETRWNGVNAQTVTVQVAQSLLSNGTNTVRISAVKDPGVPYSTFYLESFFVRYQRLYEAVGNSLVLRGDGNRAVTVGGFSAGAIKVLDITDRMNPVVVTGGLVEPVSGGYRVSFTPASATREYLAVATAARKTALRIEADVVSNLKERGHRVDYLVVAPAEFAEGAGALAAYRAGQGLRSEVALLEDIYDEFGYGIVSPYAIKSFLGYALTRWDEAPGYVVLAGAGTYDYKDYKGVDTCIVPPLMVATPYGLSASDNRLADADGDGLPDAAIGRLPVLTTQELARVIEKISAYEASGEWQKKVMLVADNADIGGNFPGDSEAMRSLVAPDYVSEKVYLSEQTAAQARAAVKRGFNSGRGLINYLGHAGPTQLALENMLDTDGVMSLTNKVSPALVLAMSCSVNRFDVPGYDSLGEAMVVKTNGGAAGVWATVTLAYNPGSRALDGAFFDAVFVAGASRVGDAIRTSLGRHGDASGGTYMSDVYAYLGDPATRIGEGSLTFEEWRKRRFTATELLDLAISGGTGDADGDGKANLLEYALNTDPKSSGGGAAYETVFRKLDLGDGLKEYFTVKFRRRKNPAPNVRYVVEVCENLVSGTWISGTDFAEQVGSESVDSTIEEVTYRIKRPGVGGRAAYVRLKILCDQ